MSGILQRLTIIHQTENRLVLRELPLSDWAIVFALGIIATIIAIAGFSITAGIGFAVAVFFVFQGKIRLIDFDVASGTMTINYQSPLKKETVSQIKLDTIQRAYLYRGDDGGTQIILVSVDGEESGISVYSSDMQDWKEAIVVAINAVLFEAHKDEEL
mgnify:CR=1 FL=1